MMCKSELVNAFDKDGVFLELAKAADGRGLLPLMDILVRADTSPCSQTRHDNDYSNKMLIHVEGA